MKIVLADIAPEPEFAAGPAIVIGLACVVFAAALVILVIWLVRRNRKT